MLSEVGQIDIYILMSNPQEPLEGVGPTAVPPPELSETEEGLGQKRAKRTFWKRVGAEGFMVSLAVHVLLVLCAAFLIISVSKDSARKDPNSFATGAGGGAAGERAKEFKTRLQPKNPKTTAKTPTRITSKSSTATIALPDLPTTSMSALNNGVMGGGSSKGFGGGSGGGIGSGMGIGVGNGKNFVGRPVMGMKIRGERIAVYLDNSFSMLPYLDLVEKAIKDKFPTADVFRYFGLFLYVENGKPIGSTTSRKSEIQTVEQKLKDIGKGRQPPWTNPDNLSASGKTLFRKIDDGCKFGGIAAWMDAVSKEPYDAIVIFSDFQDAVTQYDSAGGGAPKVVFNQRPGQPSVDERSGSDKVWQTRWRNALSHGNDDKGPKLYLFSIEKPPVPFWKELVEASGGDVKMVPELRKKK